MHKLPCGSVKKHVGSREEGNSEMGDVATVQFRDEQASQSVEFLLVRFHGEAGNKVTKIDLPFPAPRVFFTYLPPGMANAGQHTELLF
mgnify:CR=1 FL=1